MPMTETIYKKSPDIVSRDIAGELILVPIRNNVADMESIYTLSDVAARIWELIDGKISSIQLKERIVEEFEVSSDEAQADLVGFLGELEAIGAIAK